MWHQKKGAIQPKPLNSPRVLAGQYFESGIADWARDKQPDWDIRKVDDYIAHATITGMGASLDYEIPFHPSGHTAMDCKLVAEQVWRNSWQEGEEIPLHIELQMQHQMACTGMQHSVVAVRVDGGDLHLLDVPRNEDIITKCEDAVSAFWEAIKTGTEPNIQYDKTVARDLYHTSDKEIVLDFSDNTQACNMELMHLVNAGEVIKKRKRELTAAHEAMTCEILAIVKDADKVMLPDGRVLWAKTIQRKASTSVVKASTYRKLTVKEA